MDSKNERIRAAAIRVSELLVAENMTESPAEFITILSLAFAAACQAGGLCLVDAVGGMSYAWAALLTARPLNPEAN